MKSLLHVKYLLENKKQVVFFDCGGDAILLALSVTAAAGFKPVAICDSKPLFWDKKLEGFTILDPNIVKEKFPDAFWFICNFLEFANGIDYLLKLGIKETKIINFEPYIETISCKYLEQYMQNISGGLAFCCTGFGKQNLKGAYYNGNPLESVQSFLENKLFIKSTLGKGSDCDQCKFIRNQFLPLNEKVRFINFGSKCCCNFKCIYCDDIIFNNKFIKFDTVARLADVLDALKQNDALSDDLHIQLSSGEISIDPRRTDLFDTIKKYDATCSILSNGYIFCDEIADSLESGYSVLNISIDAGTEPVYNQIKGIKAWHKVIENLKKYSAIRKSNIVLKYIFLPGINDNIEQIDGFIKLVSENAGFVQISADKNRLHYINENTQKACSYLITKLNEQDLNYHISAGALLNE